MTRRTSRDQGDLFGYVSPVTGLVCVHPPLCACGDCAPTVAVEGGVFAPGFDRNDGRVWNGLAYVHNAPVAGCSCDSCVGWFPNHAGGVA